MSPALIQSPVLWESHWRTVSPIRSHVIICTLRVSLALSVPYDLTLLMSVLWECHWRTVSPIRSHVTLSVLCVTRTVSPIRSHVTHERVSLTHCQSHTISRYSCLYFESVADALSVPYDLTLLMSVLWEGHWRTVSPIRSHVTHVCTLRGSLTHCQSVHSTHSVTLLMSVLWESHWRTVSPIRSHVTHVCTLRESLTHCQSHTISRYSCLYFESVTDALSVPYDLTLLMSVLWEGHWRTVSPIRSHVTHVLPPQQSNDRAAQRARRIIDWQHDPP